MRNNGFLLVSTSRAYHRTIGKNWRKEGAKEAKRIEASLILKAFFHQITKCECKTCLLFKIIFNLFNILTWSCSKFYNQFCLLPIKIKSKTFWKQFAQPAQKRFKNVALTLVFTLGERFWNVIFGKFI